MLTRSVLNWDAAEFSVSEIEICIALRDCSSTDLYHFSEGSENYDIDEVADEMFSDGMGVSEMDDSGNTNVVLMDSSAIDKTVHADFFNDFEDLFDDDDDD